jgi:hypothetical protein
MPGLGAAPGGRVGLGVETHQAGVGFGIDAKDLTGCAEDETNSFLEAVFVSAGFSTFQVSSHPGKSVSANGAIGVELIPDPVSVVGDCNGVVDGHGSRVGVEDRLPPMRLSYTLCRHGQPYGVALVTDLSQPRGYCARMAPEDIQHLIDRAIRDHEMRVALWSGLLGALLMAGTWHAIWLCR